VHIRIKDLFVKPAQSVKHVILSYAANNVYNSVLVHLYNWQQQKRSRK